MTNQLGRRRDPKPIRGLVTTMTRAIQDTDLPPETKEQLRHFAELIQKRLQEMDQQTYLGAPAPHSHEDDQSGGVLDGGAELVAYLAYLDNC